MSVVQEFDTVVSSTAVRGLADDRLLPGVLASACLAVLPVDGASLSLSGGLVRMPLGASDETAATAEMLQFTQGDGPCLEVYESLLPTRASSQDMQSRWPAYYEALMAKTPYRSAASVPFLVVGKLVGALDLYSCNESAMDVETLDDAMTIAGRMVSMLTETLDDVVDTEADDGGHREPVWMHGSAAGRRGVAWIAIGMVRSANSLDAPDALDLIRAYSWSHDLSFDVVAAQLASRELTTEHLLSS